MTQRKGLSQILYLIIAASVLMMVALSLIFMFNDSVGGGTGDASACRTAISTQCSATGASTVYLPPNCQTSDGSLIAGVQNQNYIEEGDDGYVGNCDPFRSSNGGGDDGANGAETG